MTTKTIIGIAVVVSAVIALTLNAQTQRKVDAALAIADRAETATRLIAAQRDSARAQIELRNRLDSLQRVTYTADSASWAASTDAARVRADRAFNSARVITTELRNRLTDSVTIALVDSITVETRRVVVALTDENQDLKEERASLWRQRATLQQIVMNHEDKDLLDAAQLAEQAIEIAALRSVVTPPLFGRILGALVSPELLTGVGIGVVIRSFVGGA